MMARKMSRKQQMTHSELNWEKGNLQIHRAMGLKKRLQE